MRQGGATREAGERVGVRAFQPAQVMAPPPQRSPAPGPMAVAAAPQSRVAVLTQTVAESAASPALLTSAMRELRASIRGRQLTELAEGIGASTEQTMKVCGELMAQGQVVRRGHKYFVA